MEELLRFENVSFAYEEGREEYPALRGCSVTVSAGERIAVLGENGAGKSTFFLLANGVLRPWEGTVYFLGHPVGRRELNDLRRGVGLVFQDPDVQILGGTVEEEISFGPMNLRLPRQEVVRRVEAALEQLQITHLRARAPQYLSGGEKKQISIADVLAMEPRLLLLDEPAASLDPRHRRIFEKTLTMLESWGMSLMVSTHDVDFAWRWAERVLVFRSGELAADMPPETESCWRAAAWSSPSCSGPERRWGLSRSPGPWRNSRPPPACWPGRQKGRKGHEKSTAVCQLRDQCAGGPREH